MISVATTETDSDWLTATLASHVVDYRTAAAAAVVQCDGLMALRMCVTTINSMLNDFV
jgi:hypothetical protein